MWYEQRREQALKTQQKESVIDNEIKVHRFLGEIRAGTVVFDFADESD